MQVTDGLRGRLVRKIDVRLLPSTAIIYLLCYLDRSNIGASPTPCLENVVQLTHYRKRPYLELFYQRLDDRDQ